MGLGGEDFDHSLGGELARLEAGEAELGEGLDAELGLVVLLDDVEEVLDGFLSFGHLAAHAAEVRAHRARRYTSPGRAPG